MTEPYAKVPQRILEARELSLEARLVLAWLIGRPPGWKLCVAHLCTILGITEKKWRKIRLELQKNGYFRQKKKQMPDGRFKWIHTWSTIPQNTTDGLTMNGQTTRRSATPAQPADIEKTLKNKDKGGITAQNQSMVQKGKSTSDFSSASAGIQAFLANRKGG
ncbi:hypothetical protein THMIRHAS_04900 [Thiosulfatimonas sediminis]|uniref:Helix-turn-helix domain-containing protein n=1 Tax=Thiosulfatimonas sediminis TaxID=2675054 RepID=A0A6F8PSV8_9GAMM|nr:helix-turn-helix domain-containing protein [Thiosulfatimonas sediminis]BBP45117.1 hypothetical protein THMIRHAS_04900 [Thiosulfatimonas sediminis]